MRYNAPIGQRTSTSIFLKSQNNTLAYFGLRAASGRPVSYARHPQRPRHTTSKRCRYVCLFVRSRVPLTAIVWLNSSKLRKKLCIKTACTLWLTGLSGEGQKLSVYTIFSQFWGILFHHCCRQDTRGVRIEAFSLSCPGLKKTLSTQYPERLPN